MICLISGVTVLVSAIDDMYPAIFTPLKGFKIAPTRAGGRNRIRTTKEIAAFLATVFWGVASVAELPFASAQEPNIRATMLTIITFVVLLLCIVALGDFWFVYLCFHGVFIIPGILLTPLVHTWIVSPAAWRDEQDRADKWMQEGIDGNRDST
jgi:hypothetical protein